MSTVNNAKINQTGDINLAGKFEANVLSLVTENGNIISTGGLRAAKEINLSIANFEHVGEIHTDKLTIATDKGVTINNAENTFNALEISSRSGNAINGSIEVAIKADKFAPSIKNDVTGDVTLTNTLKGGGLSFGDGEAITISGKFSATSAGDFDYGSTLTAKEISVVAQNIYKRAGTTGNFSATGNILLNAQNNVGTAENPILLSNTAKKSMGADIYGKGIYIKGVHDGILTLGNAVGDFMSVSSEGAIAQAAEKNLNVKNKLEVTAANDITLDNVGNIIKAATISGDNVKLYSANKTGLTLEGLKATGDVNITSDNSLALNGKIESANDITLTAGKDLTSGKGDVLKSGNNITLKADDVKLLGKVETPHKKMTSDKVEDLKQFIQEMPVIMVTTNKGLDMRNAANNFEGVVVYSDSKQINGSVLVTGNSPGFLAVIDKPVASDITLKNSKKDGAILLLDKGTLQSTAGNITLDMYGDFVAGAALEANNNINITSRNGSITVAKLNYFKDKVNLKKTSEETKTTSEETTATLKAAKIVKLKAAKTIDIVGQITAGRNIVADSEEINVVGNADVSASNNINMTVGEGNIGIAGSVTSTNGNVIMNIDKGNLTIDGKVRAEEGEIAIELGAGNAQIGNDTTKKNNETVVFAKRDINITTSNGIINILGNNQSASGNININGNKKAENVSANVIETDDVIGRDVADILIDAELKANESIWITTDDGNIEVDRKITVTNGNITIATTAGNIVINSNGADDMIRAQNNLDITTLNGAIDIAGKIATKDGDISITSNHDTYARRQKGITVEKTGAINPGRNVYLNAINGSIEFKNIAAKNADVKTINGNVTAETISADDTIAIELEHGNLYLNLAQSKGVAILTDDNSESSVKTIRANSVDVSDAVTVGRILPYSSGSSSSGDYQGASSSGYSGYYSTGYSTGYSNFANNSNFARNSNPYAILGTTYTNDGLTYWQNATSTDIPNYSFSEFASLTDDISHRQTRNYFEVRFIPTWLESEFMDIDFDYSFEKFGIRNATEDELTID